MLVFANAVITPQEVETGKFFYVAVSVSEKDTSWNHLAKDCISWNEVKEEYTTWKQVKQR